MLFACLVHTVKSALSVPQTKNGHTRTSYYIILRLICQHPPHNFAVFHNSAPPFLGKETRAFPVARQDISAVWTRCDGLLKGGLYPPPSRQCGKRKAHPQAGVLRTQDRRIREALPRRASSPAASWPSAGDGCRSRTGRPSPPERWCPRWGRRTAGALRWGKWQAAGIPRG